MRLKAEGEFASSEELKAKAPEVDWRALAGFRNVLVHDYLGGIDLEQVWSAVSNFKFRMILSRFSDCSDYQEL
jgi:uncharacterized protein with HEPN domain